MYFSTLPFGLAQSMNLITRMASKHNSRKKQKLQLKSVKFPKIQIGNAHPKATINKSSNIFLIRFLSYKKRRDHKLRVSATKWQDL